MSRPVGREGLRPAHNWRSNTWAEGTATVRASGGTLAMRKNHPEAGEAAERERHRRGAKRQPGALVAVVETSGFFLN